MDGNKRTAFEAAHTFLERNGFYIDATEGEVTGLMVDVARGEVPFQKTVRWIRTRMRKH